MQGHEFETWSEKIPHASGQLSPCMCLLKLTQNKTKQPPANKSLGSNEFAGESYQTYNELISILFKLFFKTEE